MKTSSVIKRSTQNNIKDTMPVNTIANIKTFNISVTIFTSLANYCDYEDVRLLFSINSINKS